MIQGFKAIEILIRKYLVTFLLKSKFLIKMLLFLSHLRILIKMKSISMQQILSLFVMIFFQSTLMPVTLTLHLTLHLHETSALVDLIETNTREQANCRLWSDMRKGRLTASKHHDI